jgi:RNA polymerase sigma factor (sigma-70 family)
MMDTSNYTDDASFRRACRRVVQGLIERHDWALLHEDDLVELLLTSAQPDASPTELNRLIRHHYTRILYEACRQTEDLGRRERAYHELFRYLFRAAYNRWPELAEDVTQQALVLVCEQIDRCRHPGAFLTFAFYKLLHAYQQERRARGSDWLAEEIGQGSTGEIPTAVQSRLGQGERWQVLLDAIKRLPDDRQQKAILLRCLGGLSDEEISARLGITVSNVRVLRHRGIARLREDEQLRSYFER